MRYYSVNDLIENLWDFKWRSTFANTRPIWSATKLYKIALKVKNHLNCLVMPFKREIMMTMVEAYKQDTHSNIWLGDSGASNHMGWDDRGMFDVKDIQVPVTVGSGKNLMATKVGNKKLTVIQKDGSNMNIILEGFKVVPGLWVNLFSITKAIKSGWNIGNKGTIIHMEKDGKRIYFDHEYAIDKGSGDDSKNYRSWDGCYNDEQW